MKIKFYDIMLFENGVIAKYTIFDSDGGFANVSPHHISKKSLIEYIKEKRLNDTDFETFYSASYYKITQLYLQEKLECKII